MEKNPVLDNTSGGLRNVEQPLKDEQTMATLEVVIYVKI